MLKKKTSEFYDKVWGDFTPDIKEHIKWLKTIITQEQINDKVILDAGCGTGIAAISFKLLGAQKVIGIDISEQALNNAKNLAKINGTDIEFIQTDLLNPLLENKKFDIIYSFGVLHHTGNTFKSLTNLLKFLKPDGKIYLALYLKTNLTIFHTVVRKLCRLFVPTKFRYPLSKKLVFLMKGKKSIQRGFDGAKDIFDWLFVPHRDHYTPEEIKSWFSEKGFETEILIPHTGRFKSTSNFVIKSYSKKN